MNYYYYIAVLVISLLVANAMRPKAQTPKPAAFEDFDFPQSAEGTPQIVIFGDVWIDDWMVVGVGNFRTEPIIR
jgi:hypothetical protein